MGSIEWLFKNPSSWHIRGNCFFKHASADRTIKRNFNFFCRRKRFSRICRSGHYLRFWNEPISSNKTSHAQKNPIEHKNEKKKEPEFIPEHDWSFLVVKNSKEDADKKRSKNNVDEKKVW